MFMYCFKMFIMTTSVNNHKYVKKIVDFGVFQDWNFHIKNEVLFHNVVYKDTILLGDVENITMFCVKSIEQ